MVLHWKKTLQQQKKTILSKFRIGATCFTSIAIIGVKLFRNYPKNMNRIHKETKDLLYFVRYLGIIISGGATVFYDGVKKSDLGNRAHILKYLHGRMIFGSFEKCFIKILFWRGTRAVIFITITKQIFMHFYCHGDRFYNQYSNKTIKTKYIENGVSRVKPKHLSKNWK